MRPKGNVEIGSGCLDASLSFLLDDPVFRAMFRNPLLPLAIEPWNDPQRQMGSYP